MGYAIPNIAQILFAMTHKYSGLPGAAQVWGLSEV